MRRTPLALCAVLVAPLLTLAGPPNPIADAERLDQSGKHDEAIAAMKSYIGGNPDDGHAWHSLGFALHSAHRSDEALDAWQHSLDLGFAPGASLYDMCCVYAVTGRKKEALESLEKALKAHFAEQETLEQDTDLDSLRDDPRFAALTGLTGKLPTAVAATRDEGWKWDLEFYGRRIAQMHYNLSAHITPEEFRDALSSLERDVPKLTDAQVRLRLRRLTARIGDGHTTVPLYAIDDKDVTRLPIHMRVFSDGLFIIGAKDHPELLGSRITRIGTLDAQAALDATRAYACVDNAMGFKAAGPSLLTVPELLVAIKAAPDESGVDLGIMGKDGREHVVRVEPTRVPISRGSHEIEGLTYVQDSIADRPWYLKGDRSEARIEHDPAAKLVYFYFGSIMNGKSEKLADTFKHVFETIKEKDAEHLVIDMRYNGGGNTGLIQPLIADLIANDRVNRHGHLWIIIGRDTFSAAQNTVNLIEKFTNATFVGEPTGSRPQFTGESTFFVLPHSKTKVYASSRYWQILDSTDERTWVAPQIATPMSYSDFAAGCDPAMAAIRKAIGGQTDSATP